MAEVLVFLDIDINGHRQAYVTAQKFVESTNLRYGFSSPNICDLGGSERRRVLESYETDFDWKDRGRIELSPAPCERLVIKLFHDKSPLSCENFIGLCEGNKGLAKGSGKKMHYLGSSFHRLIPGFILQGGDFAMNNGTGGESIWGGKYKDEKGGLALKHSKRGIVSMCNSGKNSNGSQFFITLSPAKQLDGKHVVFGEVVAGFEVLDCIEEACKKSPPASDGSPPFPITIVGCGKLS